MHLQPQDLADRVSRHIVLQTSNKLCVANSIPSLEPWNLQPCSKSFEAALSQPFEGRGLHSRWKAPLYSPV